MGKVSKARDNQKGILEGLDIAVVKELEEDKTLQVEFSIKVNGKDLPIVMQVSSALKVADLEGLYNDYIKDRMSNSDVIFETNRLDIIVNNKSLLTDLINGTGEFKDLGIRKQNVVIRQMVTMIIYFCTFCFVIPE